MKDPFDCLDKLPHDDATVKLVFDHVRNMGLAAVFFAAAAWKQRHPSIELLLSLWDYLTALLLSIIGLALVWINHQNLFSKLSGMKGARWIKASIAILYAVAAVELIKFAMTGRG